MANQEHLHQLKQTVFVWNLWRAENPDIQPDLSEANLREANLRRVDLHEANLRRADLRQANLRQAYLFGANLFGANLSGANLSQADLSQAHLSEANLSGVDLGGADLSQADLSQAHLSRAHLSLADLSLANLRWAHLSWAHLIDANLRQANLRQAHLGWANLIRTHLSGADLSEATVGHSIFADVDLRPVKGLETVKHLGPSYIDIHTIYRSRGQIPAAFLRGAGVDDTFITYIASLTTQPIQYYSCFISHASKDEPFAQRLHADLQQNNVRCWYAPEDIKGGQKFEPQLDQAIRLHDKLLLILSEHSLYSKWVIKEIRWAFQQTLLQNEQKLFPIRLVDWPTLENWYCYDDETGHDLAQEIRQYHISDFSTWKQDHDAYQQAFTHLLRDLKAASKQN